MDCINCEYAGGNASCELCDGINYKKEVQRIQEIGEHLNEL